MITAEFLKKEYVPDVRKEYEKIVNYETERVAEGKYPWSRSYFNDLSAYDTMIFTMDEVGAGKLLEGWSRNFGKPRILLPFSGCYEFDTSMPVELAVGITAKDWESKAKDILPMERFPDFRKVIVGNAYLKEVWNKSRALVEGKGYDLIFCRPLGPFGDNSYEYPPLSPADPLNKKYLAHLYRYVFLIKEIYRSLADPGIAYGQMPWLPFDYFSRGLFESKFNSFFEKNNINFKCTYDPDNAINYFRMVKEMDSPPDLVDLDFSELLVGHLNLLGCKECILKENHCRLFGVTSTQGLHYRARSSQTGAQYSNKTMRLSTDSDKPLNQRTKTIISTGWSHSKPMTAVCQNAAHPEMIYGQYPPSEFEP